MNECVSCEFYEPIEDGHDNKGLCRRYAPTPHFERQDDPLSVKRWPEVFNDDWCGEFHEIYR